MGMPGIKNFEWDDEPLMRATQKGMDKAIALLAFTAQRKIKLLISKRNPPPKYLSPSKPGEAPRYRSRELLGSIMAEKLGDAHWQVGSPFKYALWLEFGTVNMEERPFLRPILQWIRRNAPKVVVTEINRAVT